MPLPADRDFFLPYLTSREVADLPKERAVVLVPLASIEQHGPHLPVYTDSIIVQELLRRACALLPRDFPLWCLPLLPYGKSNEHGAYAGTITLSAVTLINIFMEIGASVARSGFKRLAILNSHGGNEFVEMVARDIREQTGLLVFVLQTERLAQRPGLTPTEMTYGIHAGDVETSMLLRCRPDLVQRDLAPDSLPTELIERQRPLFMAPLNYAWLTQDVTATGALGDATVASAEKGERYLAGSAAALAELLRQASEFDFPGIKGA